MHHRPVTAISSSSYDLFLITRQDELVLLNDKLDHNTGWVQSLMKGAASDRKMERLFFVFADSRWRCVCGTLHDTPNDGWQACGGNLASLRTAVISLFTHQPNLAFPVSKFFVSSLTLLQSHFCPSFYVIPHYSVTSPLSIINWVLKSFKVNLSSSFPRTLSEWDDKLNPSGTQSIKTRLIW